MRTCGLWGLLGAARVATGIVALSGVACSSNDEVGSREQPVKPGTDTGTTSDGAADGADGGDSGPGLLCPGESSAAANVFIGANVGLDIDQTGDLPGPNADLFLGGDPADNSPSGTTLKPTVPGVSSWIDWQNLGSAANLLKHRILDVYPGNGEKDPSSFPGSNSCVGAANNPSKDELLYVGAANNNHFLYLNVLRASNLGDMGYTWLFTKEKPSCGAQGNCDTWLKYTLSAGDVLVFGHFSTGGTKLLSVYKLNEGKAGVYDATDAINWDPALGVWKEDTTAVGAVAVNDDITRAGDWGSVGVKTPLANGNIEDHIFAEGAVTTATFLQQGETICGKSFWASVISKSSGTTPGGADVKDLVGPKKLFFGAISATASATPNCDGTANLSVTASDGTSAITPSCTWYEVGAGGTKTAIPGLPAGQCNVNNVNLGAGLHNLSVTVTDTGNSACSTEATTSVTPLAPVQLTVSPAADSKTCSSNPAISSDAASFLATASGGVGPYTFTWTGCTVVASQAGDPPNSQRCSVDPPDSTLCATQNVTVKADDSSASCPETPIQTRVYTKQTTVTISTPAPP